MTLVNAELYKALLNAGVAEKLAADAARAILAAEGALPQVQMTFAEYLALSVDLAALKSEVRQLAAKIDEIKTVVTQSNIAVEDNIAVEETA
ncbi:MAG: hypothetical protein GEU82_06260 [Luteitalea sp.]|nr:hypothetical protein [Luteitalea sp.]